MKRNRSVSLFFLVFWHFDLLPLSFKFFSHREVSLLLFIKVLLERDGLLFSLCVLFVSSEYLFDFLVEVLSSVSHVEQFECVFDCNCFLLLAVFIRNQTSRRSGASARLRARIGVALQVHQELYEIVKIPRLESSRVVTTSSVHQLELVKAHTLIEIFVHLPNHLIHLRAVRFIPEILQHPSNVFPWEVSVLLAFPRARRVVCLDAATATHLTTARALAWTVIRVLTKRNQVAQVIYYENHRTAYPPDLAVRSCSKTLTSRAISTY